MDERPNNLRSMLAEAKNLSELMVDLAYASLYFNDSEMALEVHELEDEMNVLVHDMREVCVLAVRRPREAAGMSSVLQVVSAIERIANAAVAISRIVTHKLGIPRELVADLSEAAEVSHRVLVSDGSHMASRPVGDFELPVATGMRIFAVKRGRRWETSIDGNFIMLPSDVLFLRGSPDGISRLRELAAAPVWQPPAPAEDLWITDLDRAVDVLVEMKNLSEAAVGLAYSSLVLGNRVLALEVQQLERLLDEMHDRLELWVLRAAKEDLDPAPLRGLLHLANAAADLGDQARQMTWVVDQGESVHPILELALGESDDVVVQFPVGNRAQADGRSLADLRLNLEPGFTVLAVRRASRYQYRPGGRQVLLGGDEVIASGPDEGREHLAALFGWQLLRDDESGEDQLVALD